MHDLKGDKMNWLKDKIKEGKPTKGIWLATGNPVVTEIAGLSGFDWAVIDMEHGLGNEMQLLSQLQALNSSNCCPIVRVAQNMDYLIKRSLDFGASAIMAPMVNTVEDAANLVQSSCYPPKGKRGFTSSSRASGYGYDFPNYFSETNAKVTIIAQIETSQALDNIEQIAAVEGIDALFLGHSDLMLNIGCHGNFESEELKECEKNFITACRKNGKMAGMLLRPAMNIDEYIKMGFSFIALGSDTGCLKNSFKKILCQ